MVIDHILHSIEVEVPVEIARIINTSYADTSPTCRCARVFYKMAATKIAIFSNSKILRQKLTQ